MGDADKTPTDGKTTLELVFQRIGELSRDSKLALKESREAAQMSREAAQISSDNNRMLKALVARMPPSGLLRASVPYAALLLALLAVIRAW